MVFKNKYTRPLIDTLPRFKASDSLKEALAIFDENEEINIDAVFTGLSWYVNELVSKNDKTTPEEVEIFTYIEKSLQKFAGFEEGTPENEFENAACVSFLENMLNYASADQIPYERFIPLLGSKSQEFCRSWDAFTGVKSPGLWEGRDKEWQQSQNYWDKIRKEMNNKTDTDS